MKLAIIGAAVAGLALALPASAQSVPETPAVGTKSGSARTGYAPPNDMVNGSTSMARYEEVRRLGNGYRLGYSDGYFDRANDRRNAPDYNRRYND